MLGRHDATSSPADRGPGRRADTTRASQHSGASPGHGYFPGPRLETRRSFTRYRLRNEAPLRACRRPHGPAPGVTGDAAMKVWIDQDLCTGDGLCEEIAPDVFTLLDDGPRLRQGRRQGLQRSRRCRGSRRRPRRPRKKPSSSPPRSAPASASSSRSTDLSSSPAPTERLPARAAAVGPWCTRRNVTQPRHGRRIGRSRRLEDHRGRDLAVDLAGGQRDDVFASAGSIANATRRPGPPSLTSGTARVAGHERGCEHEHVAARLARSVDVRAARLDLLRDACGRLTLRPTARITRTTAPLVSTSDRHWRERRQTEVRRPRRTARSRSGSNATTVASRRRPSGVNTDVARSPATTWALVTTRSSAATKPLPCWIWSHARPSTFTTDLCTRARTAGASPAPGGLPASGVVSRSKTCGNGASPTSRPSAASDPGGFGASRSTARTIAEPRTARAGHPGALANAGMNSHTPISTTVSPDAAPAIRSVLDSNPRVRHGATDKRAKADADHLADDRAQEEEGERTDETRLWRRSVQRFRDVVDEHDPDGDAGDETHPRQRATDEAIAVARGDREQRHDREDAVESVQSVGTSNRATVRKPVCATIR